MMKSPTSLIRNWNAVGVMLALSAVFAVVITTLNMPGDRATAQVADENAMNTTERAEAWWSVLSPEQRTNAFLGKDYDHDTNAADDDPEGESEGRQLPPEADGGYPALGATGTAGTGTPPTDGVIGKDFVDNLVDGGSATAISTQWANTSTPPTTSKGCAVSKASNCGGCIWTAPRLA